MKYISTCIFIFWAVLFSSFAQVSTTFMRMASAPGMNGGLSLAETSDGGFVGTGQQQAGSAGGCDVYVYKVNSCGYLQWEKLFGGAADDGGKYVQQTADGGYIVTGIYVNNPAYILLLKLDASGNLQWSETYNVGYGLFVQQTNDGGFILSGFSATGLGFGGNDIVLIKADANGNTQWKKIYGGAGDEWGDYVEQTKDGGYIVAGYTTSYGAGSADLFLLKVDSLGTKQWDKMYGGAGGDGNSSWGVSGQATSDGGYMLCGNTNSYGSGSNDILMIKTDNLGNPQWAKAYGGTDDDQPRFAHQTSDKGFIICGYTKSFGFGDLDAYLIKTDSLGTLRWSKAYGGSMYDKAEMVRETPDKGYVLSMITNNFGADYFDPIFMKTDSMGVVGCNEANCATIVSNVNTAVGAGLQEMVPAIATTNTPLITNNYSAANNFICLHCGIVPTFAVSNTTACIGNTNYFYNTTGAGKACTEWFVNGVSNGYQDTLSIVFSVPGQQRVQLVASCGNSTDTVTVALSILSYNAPAAAFNNTTVCSGNATVFTDLSTFSTDPISNWSWNFGNGSPVNTSQNPGYNYPAPGTYSALLTVTTVHGCIDTSVHSVTIHSKPNAQFDTAVVCRGDTVQFIDLSTIALPDLIQSWIWNFGDGSPVNNSQNPIHSYIPPNTYNVSLILVSNFGCRDTVTNSITVNPALTATAGFGNDTLCTGGSILLGGSPTATGGLLPYTYSWSPAAGLSSSSIANPIAAVTANIRYKVTITDGTGCQVIDSVFVVYNSSGPNASAGFGNDTLCSAGTIILGGAPTASGGISPYTYSWWPVTGLNNPASANPTTTISTNITYVLTITDGGGCKDIDSVFVQHTSAGPFADAGFGSNVLCTGGTILLGGSPTGSGGTGPYTYSWIPSAGINNTASSNPTAAITANSVYVVIVTDAAGCQNIDSVSLTYNSNGPFADAGFGNNTLCTGGTILLGGAPTASGGTSPYSFLWTPGAGLNNISSSNPTATITSNTFYAVIVTDGAGCQNIDSVHLLYNSAGPFADAGFGNNTLCTGGTAMLGGAPTGTGGISPYTFSWMPGTGLNSIVSSNPTATVTGNAVYSVIVTDGAGCQNIDSVHILFNSTGPYADAGFGNDTLCTGGTILLGGTPTGTGGTSPYTYSWIPAAGLNNITSSNPTATITANAFYAVIVTDGAGCQNIDSVHLLYNSTGPYADAGFGNNTLCTGGTILLGGNPTGTGGTSPYTFLWTPGAGLNNIISSNPTATITANAFYAVIITDGAGCQNIDSVHLIYNSTGPYADAGFGNNTLCTGGTVLLGGAPTGTGGVSPYTYSWMPGTGLNNAITSNPTAVMTSNSAYAVIVTDAGGCQNIDSVFVTFNPLGPWADAGFGNDTLCTGGTILLGGAPTAAGGTAPYNYLWAPAAGLNNTASPNPTATITANSTYYVILNDSTGCEDIDTVVILYNLNGPFADAGFGSNTLCTGGTVLLGGNPTGTGGTSPYSYFWIPSAGLNNTAFSNPTASITANAFYAVIVTDAEGCQNIDSVHILYNANGPHAEAGFGSNSLCTGGNLLLGGTPTVTGGIAPYSYLWIPAAGLNNTLIANPLAVVTTNFNYVLIVTDNTGCQDIDSVSVLYNASGPYAEAGLGSNAHCFSDPILLGGNPSGSGGTMPYTFSWVAASGLNNPGSANPMALSVTSNTVYYLTITDAAGCSNLDSAIVNILGTGLTANFIASPNQGIDPLLVQFTNQSLGTGLTYQWLFGDNSSSAIENPNHILYNNADTAYNFFITLIATDTNGCIDTAALAITVDPTNINTYPNVFTPNGDNVNDVFNFNLGNLRLVSASIFNRWGEKMYEWSTALSGWDGRTMAGTHASTGVYFYILNMEDSEKKAYQKTGSILLAR